MKKLIIFALFLTSQLYGQILNVPEIFQERDQWCWAGVSACILEFYSMPKKQCEIAEYTRLTAEWNDFGNTNCCEDPTKGCNNWNYLYGSKGSINDILSHFADIISTGINSTVSMSEITTILQSQKPFVIRWAWSAGGGHFLVCHGISGNNLYIMDPWFGEGKKISNYNSVLSNSNHTWTHTNILKSSPTNVNDLITFTKDNLSIFPNPTSDFIEINAGVQNLEPLQEIKIYNTLGVCVYNLTQTLSKGDGVTRIDISALQVGIYFLSNGDKIYKFVKF